MQHEQSYEELQAEGAYPVFGYEGLFNLVDPVLNVKITLDYLVKEIYAFHVFGQGAIDSDFGMSNGAGGSRSLLLWN